MVKLPEKKAASTHGSKEATIGYMLNNDIK